MSASEPATKADVEQLRQEMHQRFELHERLQTEGLEGHRQQQSAEHGAMYSVLIRLQNRVIGWFGQQPPKL